jgi:predicted small metal-binding protein
MKEFSCGDVVPGCVAKFRAGTEEEILQQVAAHAHADHGMSEVPSEVVSAVRRHIHDASVA